MTLPHQRPPEVIRDIMPPRHRSTDALAAMFHGAPAAARGPDGLAAGAHRAASPQGLRADAGRRVAGADRGRDRDRAWGVEDACARANAPGLTIEQACWLRRTASALRTSAATPQRTLTRHQQKAVPFFGTMRAEGIDIAAIAAGWGATGERVA